MNKEEIDESLKLCREWNIVKLEGDRITLTKEFLKNRGVAVLEIEFTMGVKGQKDLSVGINMLAIAISCKVIKEKQLSNATELIESLFPIDTKRMTKLKNE